MEGECGKRWGERRVGGGRQDSRERFITGKSRFL